MVTHISTVPTPPGGLLVYIIPVNLDLPETLKKDLHLDCYRREQSKGNSSAWSIVFCFTAIFAANEETQLTDRFEQRVIPQTPKTSGEYHQRT